MSFVAIILRWLRLLGILMSLIRDIMRYRRLVLDTMSR